MNLNVTRTEVLTDPASVDLVAKACLDVQERNSHPANTVVVAGATAATLVGHSLARSMGCTVSLAEVDAGILYIEPPVEAGAGVALLFFEEETSLDASALRRLVSASNVVQAGWVISGSASLVVEQLPDV